MRRKAVSGKVEAAEEEIQEKHDSLALSKSSILL